MSQDLTPNIPAHMANLTPQQREFVAKYVTNGGNATQAARDAGYAGGSDGSQHRQRGYEVLKSEKVQKAIRAETEEFSAKLAPKAFAVLSKNMDDPDPAIATKAAAEILDRTGYLKGRKVEHNHQHKLSNLSERELEDRYQRLLAKAKVIENVVDVPDLNEATPALIEVQPQQDAELAALLGDTPSDD